jgi:GNAT superfamily N-acetyltransferase
MTEDEREITELRRDDRSGSEAYAAVWNAVLPRYPITPAELERSRQRRPDDLRLVARLDWAVAGCGAAIRSDLPARTYMGAVVLPEHRRRGLGRGLLERVVAAARGHGSEILAAGVEEGDVGGEAFAARFGFREVLREVEVVRRLRADEVEPPPLDDVEVAPLESRPDLLPETYDLVSATMPEMPLHAPLTMPAYDRWLEEDATGEDVIGGGTLIALDGGRVVGFAGLVRRAADPLLAEHGFTGVAATHRGRGIATLLKRSQIAWAARSGYRELMTATQFDNAPMRAINDRLGYEAQPAWIRVEVPLDEVEGALSAR